MVVEKYASSVNAATEPFAIILFLPFAKTHLVGKLGK
jgi:hypothetical protein